jgi:tetratricopeptide (TPR) repeat protein
MRRALAIAVVALVAVVALAAPAAADEFGDANRAYQESRYPEAIALYESLVARGVVHEDLFYNLGNAYFRAGQLGRAIWNYERALRVEPALDDARYNLEVARTAVAGRVADRLEGAEIEPLWIRAVTFFSLSGLAIGLLVLDGLLFALLIAVRFLAVGFVRTALVAVAVFVGAAAAGNLALLAGQIYLVERVEQGIVLADQAVMREGPDHTVAERGELHPGLRVRILGAQGDWLHIRLANGVDGWLEADRIGRL